MDKSLYNKLTIEEIKEFQNWVSEDEETRKFIRRFKVFHPVIKQEILKQLGEQ